jgi:hypothetical protein
MTLASSMHTQKSLKGTGWRYGAKVICFLKLIPSGMRITR